jgi:hypothetical protein
MFNGRLWCQSAEHLGSAITLLLTQKQADVCLKQKYSGPLRFDYKQVLPYYHTFKDPA